MKSTNRGILSSRIGGLSGVGRTILVTAVSLALGLALPQASVYSGLTPFGVGLVAAINGPWLIPTYIATMMGYLLQGTSLSLRYLAAIVAVGGIRWAVSGFQTFTRSALFSATVAFVGILLTGSALTFVATPALGEVIVLFAESALAGGFAYFATVFLRELPNIGKEPLSLYGKLSAIVVLAVAMMSFLKVEIVGVSPARIVCGIAVLIGARCAGVMGGASIGALFGCAVALATPSAAAFAPAFSIGGILAGMFSEKYKWLSATMYVLSVGVIGVQTTSDMTLIIWLYEAAAAGVLFLVLPSSVEMMITQYFFRSSNASELVSSRSATSARMVFAADAMQEVVNIVDHVSGQLSALGAPDIGGACREGADEVCKTCKRRVTCWESHFSDIMDALNHTVFTLRENGYITDTDLDGYLQGCLKKERLSESINSRYREFLVREGAYRRLNELRGTVNDQFAGMAKMLEEFSLQFKEPEWFDVDAEKRLRKKLFKEKIYPDLLSCRLNRKGRMIVEIELKGKYHVPNKTRLHRLIETNCLRRFAAPTVEYVTGRTRITVNEISTFRATVGVSQITCKGESLCGDSYEVFRDSEGGQLLVLSDGMGSGGRAAVDSAMAAGLATRLIKAGFGYETVLKLINTALMVKSEDESLATLDIVDLNLFTGDVTFLKAGAGASLLYSNRRAYRVEDSSLPLGILREITFAKTDDRMVDGDILVTMSDGVSNEGLTWVEEIVQEFVETNEKNVTELAERIAKEARDRQGEEADDITVLIVQLSRNAS